MTVTAWFDNGEKWLELPDTQVFSWSVRRFSDASNTLIMEWLRSKPSVDLTVPLLRNDSGIYVEERGIKIDVTLRWMEDVVPETAEEAIERYHAAAHAMQTGVATKMAFDPAETTPKHLRVGVNSAMVDHSALAKILMDKGILTEAEYFTALADAMEREVDLYRDYLKQHFPGGTEIKLS